MKTLELIGRPLDWAVAKCKGEDYNPVTTYNGIGQEFPSTNYSTDWNQGGPIIEREGIAINAHLDGGEWFARNYWGEHEQSASAPLIAAMRCYVASKMGDEIELPEGLI